MQEFVLFIQQHWELNLALVVIIALLLLVEFLKQKHGAGRLTPAHATRLINHNDAVVIDIRNSEAYASGHIVDSISLPMADIETKFNKIEKLKAQPIILVCATGIDSPRAAALLTKKGFLSVNLLTNGIRAWRDAEMPLIKG